MLMLARGREARGRGVMNEHGGGLGLMMLELCGQN